MAYFKIGERARVVMPKSNWHGHEARIESELLKGWYGGVVEFYRVSFDGSTIDPENGLNFGFEPHELKPIQDPGHQKISWEEMADLWTPEKVSA